MILFTLARSLSTATTPSSRPDCIIFVYTCNRMMMIVLHLQHDNDDGCVTPASAIRWWWWLLYTCKRVMMMIIVLHLKTKMIMTIVLPRGFLNCSSLNEKKLAHRTRWLFAPIFFEDKNSSFWLEFLFSFEYWKSRGKKPRWTPANHMDLARTHLQTLTFWPIVI